MKQLNDNTFEKNSWSSHWEKLCFLRNTLEKIPEVATEHSNPNKSIHSNKAMKQQINKFYLIRERLIQDIEAILLILVADQAVVMGDSQKMRVSQMEGVKGNFGLLKNVPMCSNKFLPHVHICLNKTIQFKSDTTLVLCQAT